MGITSRNYSLKLMDHKEETSSSYKTKICDLLNCACPQSPESPEELWSSKHSPMITILTVVLTIVAVYIIQYFFKLYNDAKARKNFKHEKSEEQNENQRMNIDAFLPGKFQEIPAKPSSGQKAPCKIFLSAPKKFE